MPLIANNAEVRLSQENKPERKSKAMLLCLCILGVFFVLALSFSVPQLIRPQKQQIFESSTTQLLSPLKSTSAASDRAYWVRILSRIADPILGNISRGTLRAKVPIVYSNYTPKSRTRKVEWGYLEAFGRLAAGMAPWLALENSTAQNTSCQYQSAEDKAALGLEDDLRAKYRRQFLLGVQNGFDAKSPDYFEWDGGQPLVDAAFLAQAFLQAPEALWAPLPQTTKADVIREFKNFRKRKWVFMNNWVLFWSTIEVFLHSVAHVQPLCKPINDAIERFDGKWYRGDGWHSDGETFAFGYYDSYVIHPLLYHTLLPLTRDAADCRSAAGLNYSRIFSRSVRRMRTFSEHLERLIAPDGSYAVIGRSATYRTAAFQPLALLSLIDQLPQWMRVGQVRAALTAVMRKVFVDETFDGNGLLTLGVVGPHQVRMSDTYTNTGSLYITSLSFLPLGLPATHPFWTSPPHPWTSQDVFAGRPFRNVHQEENEKA